MNKSKSIDLSLNNNYIKFKWSQQNNWIVLTEQIKVKQTSAKKIARDREKHYKMIK